MCRLRLEGVCTYTSSSVPATHTKELGEVLEVIGHRVVNHLSIAGVAIAVKARDGPGGTLSKVPRLRSRVVRRVARLLLDLSALLHWTSHGGLQMPC